MKRSKVNLIAILIVTATPFVSMGFSPAMHMYIGSQTIDVWADFDPELL